jgi:hypothetical protein
MHPVKQQEEGAPEGCSGQCERCDIAGPPGHPVDDRFAGWRMVVLSSLVFLLPLLTAVAGAAMMRGSANAELGGMIAGFAAGIVAALLLVRLIRPRKTG